MMVTMTGDVDEDMGELQTEWAEEDIDLMVAELIEGDKVLASDGGVAWSTECGGGGRSIALSCGARRR